MTEEKPPRFEVTERHEAPDGSDYVWRYTPNYHEAFYPSVAEFVVKASEALTAFLKEWRKNHPDDNFAKTLEVDNVPVLTDGSLMGFLAISEIDGETYDYFPAKRLEDQ